MSSRNLRTITGRVTLATLAALALLSLPALGLGGTGALPEADEAPPRLEPEPGVEATPEPGAEAGELPWLSGPADELCVEVEECNNPSCNPDTDPDCVCDPDCDPEVDCDCVICEDDGGSGGGLDPIG